MKILSINTIIIILIFNFQLSSAQNFVDDLYFNDSEVDYSFLNVDSEKSENDQKYHSDEIDVEIDNEISYEYRLKRFNNKYDLDYYWVGIHILTTHGIIIISTIIQVYI